MRKKLKIIGAFAAVGSMCLLGCAPRDNDNNDRIKALEARVAALERQSENNGELAATGKVLTKQLITALHRGYTNDTNGPSVYWAEKANGLWRVREQ